MIRAAIAALALFAASPAKADDDVCTAVGEMSQSILEARYAGVPLSKAIATANVATEGPIRDYIRAVVMDAYKQPAYTSRDFQRQAVLDFRNTWEVACYEAFGDKV